MTNKRPVVATRLQHPFGARWVQVFALSLLATGCTPRAPGALRQAIIGGDLAPFETGVVELVSYPPSQSTLFLCTATLVHPRQLMTAAHCVDTPNHPDHTFGVFVGTDATTVDLDLLLPVAAVDYPSTYDPLDSTADVAVITLVDPLALPIHAPILDPLQPSVTGRAARLVGYGRSDYNDVGSAGLRRAVTTTVASLEPKFLVIGDATKHTCIGDSGGPAFDVGPGATSPPRLLAVNSNGPFGCTGASSFSRLDLHATWLLDHLIVDPAPDLGTDAATGAPDLLAGDLRTADLRTADLRAAGGDGSTAPDLADATDDASPGEDLASAPRRKAGGCALGGGAPDAGLLWILLVLAARTCRWRLTR